MYSTSASQPAQSTTHSMWSMVGTPHEVETTRAPRRHGNPWDRHEERSIKRMVKRGLTIPSMSSKLERSHNSVAWQLYHMGVVGGDVPIHTTTGISAAEGKLPRTVPVSRDVLHTLALNCRYGEVVKLRLEGTQTALYECLGGALFHRVMLMPDSTHYKRINDGRSLILLVPEETNGQ